MTSVSTADSDQANTVSKQSQGLAHLIMRGQQLLRLPIGLTFFQRTQINRDLVSMKAPTFI